MRGINFVIHTAAMKHVPIAEHIVDELLSGGRS